MTSLHFNTRIPKATPAKSATFGPQGYTPSIFPLRDAPGQPLCDIISANTRHNNWIILKTFDRIKGICGWPGNQSRDEFIFSVIKWRAVLATLISRVY